MAAAGLGGAILPAVVGVLVERIGEYVLGPALVVLSLVLLPVYTVMARRR